MYVLLFMGQSNHLTASSVDKTFPDCRQWWHFLFPIKLINSIRNHHPLSSWTLLSSPSKWNGFPWTPHTALPHRQSLYPRRRHFPRSNLIPPVSTACHRRRSSLAAAASIACHPQLRSPPRRTIPSQANTHKGAPLPLRPIALEALWRKTDVCATSCRSATTPLLTLA